MCGPANPVDQIYTVLEDTYADVVKYIFCAQDHAQNIISQLALCVGQPIEHTMGLFKNAFQIDWDGSAPINFIYNVKAGAMSIAISIQCIVTHDDNIIGEISIELADPYKMALVWGIESILSLRKQVKKFSGFSFIKSYNVIVGMVVLQERNSIKWTIKSAANLHLATDANSASA